MLAKRRYEDYPVLTVDEHEVLPSRGINYLEVRLGAGGRFAGHVEEAAKKAEVATIALTRLMPNVGGPSWAKRKLLMSVATSRMLYAAPVWARGPSTSARTQHVMGRVNRFAALRLIRAYKTVSGEAAAFLTGATLLDLLAAERVRIWECRREGLAADEMARQVSETKGRTLAEW